LTREKVAGLRGTSLAGNKPSYLHGRVTEPIPFWSHIYDGAWYRLKIEEGWTVSEENMAKARVAAAAAGAGVEQKEPEPIPGGTVKKGRKPKAAAPEAAAAPTAPAEPAKKRQGKLKFPPPPAAPEPAVVAPAPPAPPPPIKKRPGPAPKAKAPPAADAPPPPVATIPPASVPEPVEDILEIPVRKISLERREVFLDPKKQKVYDLKFKYLGRLKDGTIHSFPDSDAE
jgi:hypothetical protein